MSDVFEALAALLVLAHMAFVVFAAGGAVLALRWPRILWLQVPAAVWAVYIELTGGICPLTPLENTLRVRAGLDPYAGDFVARYLFPVLYPEGLTRDIQLVIGAVVVALNLVLYALVFVRRALPRRSPNS